MHFHLLNTICFAAAVSAAAISNTGDLDASQLEDTTLDNPTDPTLLTEKPNTNSPPSNLISFTTLNDNDRIDPPSDFKCYNAQKKAINWEFCGYCNRDCWYCVRDLGCIHADLIERSDENVPLQICVKDAAEPTCLDYYPPPYIEQQKI